MVRLELPDSASTYTLFEEVKKKFHVEGPFELIAREQSIPKSSLSISSLRFANGEIVTLLQRYPEENSAPSSAPPAKLDDVDIVLYADEGLIARKRNTQMCRHSDGQQCIHCCSLQPYDESVQKGAEKAIKFMSFHTYLRKLNTGADRGKFTMLETQSCRIAPGCTTHAPWPAGICTKCQPSAVLLSRQPFRHVDYLQFESPALVNEFLNAWRATGCQRAGWLYGKHERYDLVPLGIQAVVGAIYEPPQSGTAEGLVLTEDPALARVDEVAAALGMQRVGWIFTDLVADDRAAGTVRCTRHLDDGKQTTLFTAQEIMMASRLQRSLPNRVSPRFSRTGEFGSKFVSVVVSGLPDGTVGMKAYQVSDQAMALERDEVILPSAEGPGFMFVRPSSDRQYVPDVFYSLTDKYGNDIKTNARPSFPVEYLLVDFACGAATTKTKWMLPGAGRPFPPANRLPVRQTPPTLRDHLQQPGSLLAKLSDFNLLVHLATEPALAELQTQLPRLLAAVREQNEGALMEFQRSPAWRGLEDRVGLHGSASAPAASVVASRGGSRPTSSTPPLAMPVPPSGPRPASSRHDSSRGAGAGPEKWNCTTCTLINYGGSKCSVCDSPRPRS